MINRVTVIGGSGFVGRATVEQLARAGKQVIVLCRNSERAKFLKPMGNVGQITIVAGNVLDDALLSLYVIDLQPRDETNDSIDNPVVDGQRLVFYRGTALND